MTPDEWNRAIRIVDRAFSALAGVADQGTAAAVHAKLADGKLYELRVLAWLLARLKHSGYSARLVNGHFLLLRHRPGVVNRAEPYIELLDAGGAKAGEIWCNVEFVGLGFEWRQGEAHAAGASAPAAVEPDYHELDIAVTWHEAPNGRLPREAISIGIECKDRRLEKRMLREVLGLRRELSYMRAPRSGWQFPLPGFAAIAGQDPPIRLFLCSSSPLPKNYDQIAGIHAIHIEYVPV